MLKRIAKRTLHQLGYEIRRIRPGREETPRPGKAHQEGEAPSFVLYEYPKPDGSFDYERYRQTQEAGNKRKVKKVWVIEDNIEFLSEYIRGVLGDPRFGICHGTRRGMEQAWFRKYLGCEVIGTEISDTAESFPHSIQWDFHDTKPEWIDATDFIYSNSLDHSYDPRKCLNAWMSCIRKGGVCIIEHSRRHGPSTASDLDPFGADLVEMPYLITQWGEGRYGVRQVLEAPARRRKGQKSHFIVVHRF